MSTMAMVLTSAGIAAFVSGVFTILDRALERRSRRQELALGKALEMAIERRQLVTKVAENTGKKVDLYDDVVVAEVYYRWLKHLLDTDELPDDVPNRLWDDGKPVDNRKTNLPYT